MAQTQKKYDYDAVKDFTSSGRDMDQALTKIQTDLKALRELVNRMEPLYHGKGTTDSVIYKQYAALYNNIGDEGRGLWLQVNGAAKLQNFMYNNAIYDKEADENAAADAAADAYLN